VWDLDIVLDTPTHEAIEISSSSCHLSIFSSIADYQRDEGAGAAPRRASSASIGKLWPDIDELDEISREGTSVGGHQGGVPPEQGSAPSIMGTGSGVLAVAKRASTTGAPGPSSVVPRSCGRGSARDRAAWILSDILGAIAPRMRRSFVDRQYSTSTGMDRSEWENILDELTHMGYIVKK
jgi:hypothetical protein